ncbi:hypothetical protein [Pseudooceanicola sp. HF7]|uniref:DoxX family protein n=1 Tax=Pseudooceanicola sp. HF7 TaxID=2721560 RepID=UPI001431BCEA|nr:hypothetical protein [Pseudooceanicola sp. HF7]NIZ10194.1 hypothetical protein [Pseudooceanicola sp. HF7]
MRTPVIILLLLTGPWLLAQGLSPTDMARAQSGGLAGLVLAFTFFGIGHFAMTEQMIDMLPPWVPARRAVVLLTGVLEFALAIALVIPATRSVAGWTCAAVLVGFFAVNVYASFKRRGGGGHDWGPLYLLVRSPLQVLLVYWCLTFSV